MILRTIIATAAVLGYAATANAQSTALELTMLTPDIPQPDVSFEQEKYFRTDARLTAGHELMIEVFGDNFAQPTTFQQFDWNIAPIEHYASQSSFSEFTTPLPAFEDARSSFAPVSYTHLTLPTTPYV